MEDLTGGTRQLIAAGVYASLSIKPFKAMDQTNPGLLQQVVELFGSTLLLATGRAVGQAKVLESLLIPPCNGGRKPMSVLMAQVTLRNQGISTTDPTVQRSTSEPLALR